MLQTQEIVSYVIQNLGVITLFVLFVSLVQHIYQALRQRRRLPPGPTGLPLVGYLPFLGKHPHEDIAKLSDKYGNVFTLQLGINNVVILNDIEAVKDAFHKDAFLGRANESPFTILDSNKGMADMNGPGWKEHRRFTLQLLRDLGFGKGSMEDRIVDEIGHLIKYIDQTEGKPTDIHALLVPSMSNNICHLVFGHRYDFNEPKRICLDQGLEQVAPRLSPIGLFATAPIWLSRLILRVVLLKTRHQFEMIFHLLNDEIVSHEEKFNENSIRDYIDGYLAEMNIRKKKDPNTTITKKILTPNVRSLFGAGSETVRTTTEWLLLLSAKYPEHQKRIQKEIDSVIGNERNPTYADRVRMPFTQAFINEMLRWKNTLPLNLMRRATEDSSICGHFIPKDTLVLANFWAVHNDPKIWDKPEEFNPNRFLSDDGKDLIKTEALIPFSIGKRSCTGETLARVEVFLYFASLLQQYSIRAPEGKIINLEDVFGLTLQPKYGSTLIFKRRF